MARLRLALVQFARGPSPIENLKHMVEWLSLLKNVDLAVLPENWYSRDTISNLEFRKVNDRLRELISKVGLTLVAGAHYVDDGSAVMSRGEVLSKDGVVARFEKHHPSSAIGERGFLKPGGRMAVFEVGGVKVGVAVCVDLMYPELIRGLALRGAELIANPANIPANRRELWKYVGVTRAAENTVFLAFVNNTFTNYLDGRSVMGGSYIASPEGSLILEAEEEEGLKEVVIDTFLIDQVRKRRSFLLDVMNSKEEFLRRYYLYS